MNLSFLIYYCFGGGTWGCVTLSFLCEQNVIWILKIKSICALFFLNWIVLNHFTGQVYIFFYLFVSVCGGLGANEMSCSITFHWIPLRQGFSLNLQLSW